MVFTSAKCENDAAKFVACRCNFQDAQAVLSRVGARHLHGAGGVFVKPMLDVNFERMVNMEDTGVSTTHVA